MKERLSYFFFNNSDTKCASIVSYLHQICGVFSNNTSATLWMPTECLTMQFNSDISYLELASHSTDLKARSYKTALTSSAGFKYQVPRLQTLLSDLIMKSRGSHSHPLMFDNLLEQLTKSPKHYFLLVYYKGYK